MIYDVMRSRRSVRQFKPDMPSRELLEQLVRAAVTAPSASNKQPWRFLVVTAPAVIAELERNVREAVERIFGCMPAGASEAFRAYGDYFSRFSSAPVVIVPIFRGAALLSNLVGPGLPERDRELIVQMERDSGLIGASLALQNLLLMAHHLGLGASAMTGPLVAADRIKAALDIPAGWGIVALVPVGFPAEEPGATERKPITHVTRWIQ